MFLENLYIFLCFKIYLVFKVCSFLGSCFAFLELDKYVAYFQILVIPHVFVPYSLLSKFEGFINPGRRIYHFMCNFLRSTLDKNYLVLVVSDIVSTGFVSDVIVLISNHSFLLVILLLQPTSIFVCIKEIKGHLSIHFLTSKLCSLSQQSIFSCCLVISVMWQDDLSI